jgi:hypothetical protein
MKDEPRRVSLVGCDVFQRELAALRKQEGWPLELRLLPATLHADLDSFKNAVTAVLDRVRDGPSFSLFGYACHPMIPGLLRAAQVTSLGCQDCFELILGRERYVSHLAAGAYFLNEAWSRHWQEVVPTSFGDNEFVMARVFKLEHRYVLALRTPYSVDYGPAARRISEQVGLPLRWCDVTPASGASLPLFSNTCPALQPPSAIRSSGRCCSNSTRLCGVRA